MRIKTVADASADFRARALRRGFAAQSAARPDAGSCRAAVNVLKLALEGKPYDGALDAITDDNTQESYICPKCGDTGAVGGSLCECFRAHIYRECYGAADISLLCESFENFDLSIFDDDELILGGMTQRDLMAKLKARAQKYAASLPNPKKPNMLIAGAAGLGKTYLLRCIAAEAQARGADVLLIDYPSLHALFHAHRMGENVDFSFLNSAGLLLADDLGAEPPTANVSVEYLFALIEARINAALPTVFTTNVPNLAHRYTEPIASRLMSDKYGVQYKLEGKDLRQMRNVE